MGGWLCRTHASCSFKYILTWIAYNSSPSLQNKGIYVTQKPSMNDSLCTLLHMNDRQGGNGIMQFIMSRWRKVATETLQNMFNIHWLPTNTSQRQGSGLQTTLKTKDTMKGSLYRKRVVQLDEPESNTNLSERIGKRWLYKFDKTDNG